MGMAKNRPRDDFDDAPQQPQAGLVELPPERGDDPEKAALAARVAELEAQLAERDAAGRAAEVLAPLPHSPSGYWKVQLKDAPTHCVEAKDGANAWEVYKAELGVTGSVNSPEVGPASREEYRAAQARRHKLKPEEFALPDD